MFNDPNRELETEAYLQSKRKRGGRPQTLDECALSFLRQIIAENQTAKLSLITRLFCEGYYGDIDLGPCQTTVWNALRVKLRWSRKVMTRRNIAADPSDQVEFLLEMAYINALRLVSIDGMIQKKEDYHKRMGYAPIGEECVWDQIVIGSKSFPVMCAVCSLGILAFVRYESGYNVTNHAVQEILKNEVRVALDNMTNDPFCILDNASNQCTDGVYEALDDVFGDDNYAYLPPYSPHLAPIEKVFSLVKTYIRNDERRGEMDPGGIVDEALTYYMIGNPGAISVNGFFEGYSTNHHQWLADQEIIIN